MEAAFLKGDVQAMSVILKDGFDVNFLFEGGNVSLLKYTALFPPMTRSFEKNVAKIVKCGK